MRLFAIALYLGVTSIATAQSRPDIAWQIGGISIVNSTIFAPDQMTLLTGNDDRTLKFWDPAAGRLLWTLSGHTGAIREARYSPDGTRIATAGWDFHLKIWRLDGTEELDIPDPYHITSIAWSPDGTRLATSSLDRNIRVWNSNTGGLVWSTPTSFLSPNSVFYTRNGAEIIAGGGENTNVGISFYRAGDGVQTRSISPDANYLPQLALSADGNILASANGYRYNVQLFSVQTGALLHTLSGHVGPVFSVAFSANNQFVASGTGGSEMNARIWNANTGALLQTLPAHSNWVKALTFTPDNAQLIVCSSDIRVWQVANGQLVRLFGPGLSRRQPVFTGGGQQLWVPTSNVNSFPIYDARDGTQLRTLPTISPSSEIAVSADDSLYIPLVNSNQVQVRRSTDGGVVATLTQTYDINDAAFSRDGRYIVTGGGFYIPELGARECVVKIWDAATYTLLRTFASTNMPIREIVVSPDSQTILSAGDDGLRFWRIDGTLLNTLTFSARGVSYSPNGNVVAAGNGRDIYLLDGSNGSLLRTLPGHTDLIYATAFSPDSARVIASEAGAGGPYWLRILRVSDGTALQTYTQDVGNGSVGVAWSQDGRRIACSRLDTTLMIIRDPEGQIRVDPTAFSVYRGVREGGGLAEMRQSDDQYLVVRNGITALPTESPIAVIFDGTSPNATLSALKFTAEAHVSITGLRQRIDFYDFAAAGYEELDSRPASLTDTETAAQSLIPGRFIETGSNSIRARLRFRPEGPVFSNTWRAYLDLISWTAVP